MSLFEQLGAGLDVVGQVEVPKMHRYAEDADQGEIAPAQIPATSLESVPENMTDMKFTHSLIKHLDMLYSRMLAGEISGMTQSFPNESDEEVIDIAGLPHIKKNSYYNPGNSAVTEST
jgi:hypothetical protein|tara:strand:+ start:176 stop:529 length:354 start_codon:yes stop_codon:yes gene_type:complete